MIVLSFFSPYEGGSCGAKSSETSRHRPTFVFGTTSQGEDVFWSTTFAIRNTLTISIIAVTIGRGIGVMLGMLSGYFGGIFDRVAQSIVESFIVIPRLPLLYPDRVHPSWQYDHVFAWAF